MKKKISTLSGQVVHLEDFEDSAIIVENDLINVSCTQPALLRTVTSSLQLISSEENFADSSDDDLSNHNKNMSVNNINVIIDEGDIKPILIKASTICSLLHQ